MTARIITGPYPDYRESERRYYEHEVVTSAYIDTDDWGDKYLDTEGTTFYEDEATGILVGDVFKFEATLREQAK